MSAGGVEGTVSEGRAGARILSLLAVPLNGLILEKLSRGPQRLAELRRETGSPPQTTLRSRLRELAEIGVVTKRRLGLFPGIREYELTSRPGRELRFVATTLEGWLGNAPEEPLPYGSEAARAATKALVDGWSSTILGALAANPLTLPELDRLIAPLSPSSLERRLAAMRGTGLIEARPGGNSGGPYTVSEWARLGIAPLAAAIRWERNHLPHATPPIAPTDAEAGFLLAIPLLSLPAELSGTCRLGVEFADGGDPCLVGVTVEVEKGRIASCTTRLESSPGAWATGPAAAWLRTAIEADPTRLAVGGDRRLVHGLVDGLNRTLFGPAARPRPRP
jgi:DNA-binding HxlR family transcriptional regulator